MDALDLELSDLLALCGFDLKVPTKLVRHKGGTFPIEELRRRDLLELYQSYQSSPVFDGVDQVISFYGGEGRSAHFYGIYRVGQRTDAVFNDADAHDRQVMNQETRYLYTLERDEQFHPLRHRITIDWGLSGMAWHQWLHKNPKKVTDYRSSGRTLPPFVDYLALSLSFGELCELFKNETAHQDWQKPLYAVAGIYLVSDEQSGALYIGSASGVEGVWGRWKCYSENGHGGNKHIMALLENAPGRENKFRFSLLQTLPKSWTQKQVEQREVDFKIKFGKNAITLNGN
jgi:hypothetical protein